MGFLLGLIQKFYCDRLVLSATIATVSQKARSPTFSVYPIYIQLLRYDFNIDALISLRLTQYHFENWNIHLLVLFLHLWHRQLHGNSTGQTIASFGAANTTKIPSPINSLIMPLYWLITSIIVHR